MSRDLGAQIRNPRQMTDVELRHGVSEPMDVGRQRSMGSADQLGQVVVRSSGERCVVEVDRAGVEGATLERAHDDVPLGRPSRKLLAREGRRQNPIRLFARHEEAELIG